MPDYNIWMIDFVILFIELFILQVYYIATSGKIGGDIAYISGFPYSFSAVLALFPFPCSFFAISMLILKIISILIISILIP